MSYDNLWQCQTKREINRAKLPNRDATCPPALINFKCYDSNNRGKKGACCFTATNLIRELLIKEIQDWGQLPDNHKCKGRNWYHQFPMVPYTMGTVTNTPNN